MSEENRHGWMIRDAVDIRWKTKRDPVKHPVRFLAAIWETRTGAHLSSKEMGQLRDLLRFLGDFTRHIIEWMLDGTHWELFCEQVVSQGGRPGTPPHPDIGYLLKHRNRALNIMRSELKDSAKVADVKFCVELDALRCRQWKQLAIVYADGRTDWLARIDAAETITDFHQVFIELLDAHPPVPASSVQKTGRHTHIHQRSDHPQPHDGPEQRQR